MPLIASATATFLFRQFFLTMPDELRRGGAHRRRRADALLQGRRCCRCRATNIAALFVIHVHLRLEPVPVAAARHHARRACTPVVIGIKRMIAGGDAADRMEPGDGDRDPGDAAAGAGRAADAEVVRQGPGRHREMRTRMGAISPTQRRQALRHRAEGEPGDPRRRRRDRRRRVRRHRRPVGLRQVDAAAHGRRARGDHRRRDRDRRARRQRARADGARHRDGVPELRALPAHDACSTTWPTA